MLGVLPLRHSGNPGRPTEAFLQQSYAPSMAAVDLPLSYSGNSGVSVPHRKGVGPIDCLFVCLID